MFNLIDTHAHLDEIKDLNGALERAEQTGVKAIIAVGQNFNSNQKTLELAACHAGFVYPALGLHPWALGSMDPPQIEENLSFITKNLTHACALGEVGLDYDKRVLKVADREIQKVTLRRLLQIALEHEKPVCLHSRYAWKDCLQLAKETGIGKLVFHWYTGFSSTLSDLIERGYFISATPAAEYHAEHRRAIKEIPVEQLLLETDCPVYYGREKRYPSEPADVVRSLKSAAEIRGIDKSDLATITTENARNFFGI